MGLTLKQQERIERLDFSKGGGFSDFITNQQKLDPAKSKFLFVGLGGKGSSVVSSIKTGVYKKIKCNPKKNRPDNFEYLVVDTEVANLEKLQQPSFGEIGLSAKAEDMETCVLNDSSFAAMLAPERKKNLPENVKEWINPNMNQELQGKGAGGVRQAGRFLLFSPNIFRILENTLTSKLAYLHGQIMDSTKEELIVYIFAGVGGGTGSGTIIDIPYIIREICRRNNWNVKVYSYIFLPDTYPSDARNLSHVQYNSYAALKEIDTLMNIGQMDGAARFKAQYVPGFEVDSAERIFDSCVLVSGQKENGLVSNPERFSKRVVVDNIINLVTDNQTSQGFLVNSFLDNSPTMIQASVNQLPNVVPRNAYYQYTVIGTGELILPMEQVLAYISHGTLVKLWQGWDNRAQQNDVEKLLSQVQMKPEELAHAIIGKSETPLMQYSKGIGGSVKKAQVMDGTLYNTIHTAWLNHNVPLYNAWDKAKNMVLEFVIKQLYTQYRGIFTDKAMGIFFLKELLSYRVVDGKDFNGIYYRITEEYKASVAGLIAGQNEIQAKMNQRMEVIKDELSSPLCVLPGGLIEEYRELCVAKLVSDNMVYMYDNIVWDCLNQIESFLEERMKEVQTYIDVFTYMKEVVERNYRSVMNGTMPQEEFAATLINFSNVDNATQNIINFMNNMLNEKTPQGLATALAAKILETENQWVHSDEEFNPMKVFVDFLENQYTELPNLTIEKFIQEKYRTANVQQGLQNVCQQLKNKADVIFPANPLVSLQTLSSQQYAVIPAGASSINQSMNGFAQVHNASIAHSNDMNSMFWYNIIIGVPMFLLKDIDLYEKAYEKNITAGNHIRENEVCSWKEWPNLSSQTLWSTVNQNTREREYIEKVEKDTKKYRECGLIDDNYRAHCIIDEEFDISKDKIIKWCKEIYLEENDANTEKALVDAMIVANADRFVHYNVNIPTVYMNVQGGNLYKMLRMNVFLYQKLQKTYQVLEECKKLMEEEIARREAEFNKVKNVQRFYDYIRTGIIQTNEDGMYLERKDGEQFEIIDFNDYSRLEKQFYIYEAFQCFVEKFEEEFDELDDYKKELAGDKSKEAKEKYKVSKEKFLTECENMRTSLKKVDTKKSLERIGKGNMISVYNEFIATLIDMI